MKTYTITNSWLDTELDGDNGRIFVNIDTMEAVEEIDHKYQGKVTEIGQAKLDKAWASIAHYITVDRTTLQEIK